MCFIRSTKWDTEETQDTLHCLSSDLTWLLIHLQTIPSAKIKKHSPVQSVSKVYLTEIYANSTKFDQSPSKFLNLLCDVVHWAPFSCSINL